MRIHELWSRRDEELLEAFGRGVAVDEPIRALHALAASTSPERAAAEALFALWGDAVRDRLAAGLPAAEALRAVVQEAGFTVGDEDLAHPSGARLFATLVRRHGHPLVLVAVVLEIARRAGVAAEAVGLPGAFLVRVGAALVDHQGRALERADCEALVRAATAGKAEYDPERVQRLSTEDLLEALLRHLAAVHGVREEHLQVYRVMSFACALHPEVPRVNLQRAAVAESLGAGRVAHALYQEVARRFPGTLESQIARERLQQATEPAFVN